MLIFKTISRVRTRLIAGLWRPWTATWERYWNLAVLWDRPHVRTHRTSSKAFDNVRHASIAVDRGGRREFECYLNLLMLDFWYSTVPHVRTLKKVMDSIRMPSTVDGVWTHANACEGVSENAALILDCWPLHTAERFGPYIVSYRDILCSIVSYPSFSPTTISCHHYKFLSDCWYHVPLQRHVRSKSVPKSIFLPPAHGGKCQS